MRRPALLSKTFVALLLAAPLVVLVPGTADSAADTCWYTLAGAPQRTTHAVPGPWPNGFGNGSCSSGNPATSFLSSTPPCPPAPFVGAWYGQFCGPVFPPGVQVFCTATVGSSFVRLEGIVAGFDQDGDGHLTATDGPVGFSATPAGAPTVAPYVQSGHLRVIAYPIATATVLLSPVTDVQVGCS